MVEEFESINNETLKKEKRYRWRDGFAKTLSQAQIAARGERPYRKMTAAAIKQQLDFHQLEFVAQRNAVDAHRRVFGTSATQMLKEEEQRLMEKHRADRPHEGLVELAAVLAAMPEDTHDYSQMPNGGTGLGISAGVCLLALKAP